MNYLHKLFFISQPVCVSGALMNVNVYIENMSEETYGDDIFVLGRFFNESGKFIELQQLSNKFPKKLMPSDSDLFPITVKVPEMEGDFFFFVDILHRGNGWFSAKQKITPSDRWKPIKIINQECGMAMKLFAPVIMETFYKFKKIYVNINDLHIGYRVYNQDKFQAQEFNYITKYITQSKYILDVGANIGLFSLHSYSVNNNIEIQTVEANEQTYELLKLNTSDIKQIVNHNIAVSDKTGTATLYKDIINEGATSFTTAGQIMSQNMGQVNTVCVDDWFAGKRFDFIKCDIEGSESRFIRGGRKVIEESSQSNFCMMIEVYPKKLDSLDRNWIDEFTWLFTLGLFAIDIKNNRYLSKDEFVEDALSKLYENKDYIFTNIKANTMIEPTRKM